MEQVIVPVLLFSSALIGAAAGLRFKVFALVPIAILIALASAAVLRKNDFGTGSGIATIIACLVVNQAAYIIVQLFTPAADSLSDQVADSEPSQGREQGIRSDNGDYRDRKPSPSGAFKADFYTPKR
ncbi:hypothetical protein GGQ85_004326 [Nitrobacter vulgaris]|jgi:hypothetical protein|uniref:hypothetical protein n=1 Tax=Nitrobacter vulgaris TaxID=29421 RepID=UPI002858E06D|nr:hypothetical protein [Nitrobacter vulgaris]MDR6306593.1 hypothetical protein [Nitrobacter vulgaris]